MGMIQRSVKSAMLCIASLVLMKNVIEAAEPKPNIIYIMGDDMAYNTIKYFGGNCYTPTFDYLANNGVVFTRAYMASAVCSPSRYTVLTGRFISNCTSARYVSFFPGNSPGISCNNEPQMETDGKNIQSVLKANGYVTGQVGKWHLYKNPGQAGETPYYNPAYGFKDIGTADPKTNSTTNTNIKFNHDLFTEKIREVGFDYCNAVYPTNVGEVFKGPMGLHNMEWVTKSALDFITLNKDKTFFLYFCPTLTHSPSLTASLNNDPGYTGEGYVIKDYSFMPTRTQIKQEVQNKGYPDTSAPYTWFDYGIKAILDKLRAFNLEEKTVIIFHNDNGINGKASVYENGTKTQAFVYWKGHISPYVCNEQIENVDHSATIMDLAGVTKPAGYVMNGTSYKLLLNGNQTPIREYLYCEAGCMKSIKDKKWKYIAVRYPRADYEKIARGEKYNYSSLGDALVINKRMHINHIGLAYRGGFNNNSNAFEDDQLYDLDSDPTEKYNLAYSYTEKLNEMKLALKNYITANVPRTFGEFYQTVAADRTYFENIQHPIPTDIKVNGVQQVIAALKITKDKNSIIANGSDGARITASYIKSGGEVITSGSYPVVFKVYNGDTERIGVGATVNTTNGVAVWDYKDTVTGNMNIKATLTAPGSVVKGMVIIQTTGNIPPVVNITAPANGATYTAPASVTINATASDSDGSVYVFRPICTI